MMMTARILVVLAIAVICAAVTTPCAAQDEDENKAEAKRHFAAANERLEVEDYNGAIALYQKALALLPHALIRYNMGVAYNRKADPVRAIATLRKALRGKPALSPKRKRRAEEIISENANRVARMTVSSNVEGADVRVDGELVGQTPLVEHVFAAKWPVMVEVRKTGFMPVAQLVRAPGGATRRLDLPLAPIELAPAELRIASKLPGAEVYVDGRLVAVTPVRTTLAVTPRDTHRVELRRDGYETAVETFNAESGTEVTVQLTPEPDPQEAATTLTFDVSPRDASVRVDGTFMPRRTVRLAAGLHRVTVERTGYETAIFDLDLPRKTSHTVRYALMPTSETRAALIDDAESFRAWGYGLLIGGAVLTATGAALLVFNGAHNANAVERDRAVWESDCPEATRNLDPCPRRDADLLDREDGVQALWIVSPILAVAGVASLTTGIVMLVTGDDPTSFALDGDELGGVLMPVATVGAQGGYVGIRGTF